MMLQKSLRSGLLIAGIVAMLGTSVVTAESWLRPAEAAPLLISESSQEIQAMIAQHRQAAGEAQKKVAFHEEMEKKFKEGRGGSKIDMVGHCRYWANHYKKLAAQEEQAAKNLE